MTPPAVTKNPPTSTGGVVGIGVGSTVRAPRRRPVGTSATDEGKTGNTPKRATTTTKITPTGRATVATISRPGDEEDDDPDSSASAAAVASILWDDPAPRPLKGDDKFIVTPTFDGDDGDGEEEEDEVPLSDLSPLLPFEVSTDAAADGDEEGDATESPALGRKGEGDALYRLGDPSAAAERYESALALLGSSDVPSIGGVVLINVGGHPTPADVDCVDDEDDTLDVTYVDGDGNEVEKTTRRSEVLLVVNRRREGRLLQGRTLLNLSRCMLLLADVDGGRRPGRRKGYLLAAVLGSSLALTLACHGDDADAGSDAEVEVKARTLRTRGYLELGRFRHATSDVRRILSIDPRHGEAKSIEAEVKRREARKKLVDKRLAKDVCGWVRRATAAGEEGGGEAEEGGGGGRVGVGPPSTTVSRRTCDGTTPECEVTDGDRRSAITNVPSSSSAPLSPSLLISFLAAAVAALALLVPSLLGGRNGTHGVIEEEL